MMGHPLWTLLLLAVVLLGPMVYRELKPTPQDDIKVIQRFLDARHETLVRIQKLSFGGPSLWIVTTYHQGGRPYRVTSKDANGAWRTHFLATDGTNGAGEPQLKEQRDGEWRSVVQ